MNLQVIKTIEGRDEYVLLPINIYHRFEKQLQEEYVLFNPADYVNNPVALARIEAGVTQTELAERLGVSQAYVSKLENQAKPTAKTLHRVRQALVG